MISRSPTTSPTNCARCNCSLALDDFGAGYSSLARLRQLPFSELKIDRSYVTDCHLDKVNAGLCETIVELAKRFELKTVAEGIETVHESHKLQGIGCDIGQGYLFAKPMAKATVRRPAQPARGRRTQAAREAALRARQHAARLVRRDVTANGTNSNSSSPGLSRRSR